MNHIIKFIYTNGLWAMFTVILLEYACFPVSSEIVLPFSGAFASVKDIPFLIMLTASVTAGIIGTSFCYLIGRVGGDKILHKIMTKFPSTKKSIEASYQRFEQYGTYIVCFGRMIPIIRTYIAFVAGAVKQSYLTFFLYSVLGITVWNATLIGIGYVLRDNWTKAITYYERYKNIIIPVLLLALLFFIYRRINKKNKNSRFNDR